MRRHRRIRRRSRFFSALGLLFVAAVGRAFGAEAIGAYSSGSPESAAAWLPDPAENLDEPERLAEPSGAARLRLVTSQGGAGAPGRRLWWGSRRIEGTLSLGEALLEGGVLVRAGSISVSGGSIALQDPGLVAEVAGVARRTRAVGATRGAGLRVAARPATGAACDVRGAAIGWNFPIGRLRVAGGTRRRGVGEALALEGRVRSLTLRAIQVRAGTRRESYGSVAIRRAGAEGPASVEAGAGPLGSFGRLGLDARQGRLEGAARYQIESWRDRPGSLDLEGAWTSRKVAARVRWRSWSGPATPRSALSAPEDDGRIEVDLRLGSGRQGGAGVWRVRVGSRPRQADGSGGERFVVGDWTVARERGRTLHFIAGRRDAQTENEWRRGRSAGSLLELEWGDRAAMTLSVEAVRAGAGGGSYGPGLDVAETGSLRARTRSGVRAAARGWLRIGSWRLGAAADDEDDGTEFDETTSRAPRAPRVTIWLAWSGGETAP
ncbi:MAG TPA: hypothetical protein VFS09_06430 [Candidatus Eisenbacteria bacterium]|nr:hypothetical protein [Candidatus Eisenbacteria bacterium]